MASLNLALVVVCVVALIVESTRWIGVLCLALLIVLHPILTTALLLIAGGVTLYLNFWRDR